jgi:DNA-directed RNA polymerase subunit RPC12/RpoP
MQEEIYRCNSCGKSNIAYHRDTDGFIYCGHCGSAWVTPVILKGNPAQRKAIKAGYDQIRSGLYLHFNKNKMIIHEYGCKKELLPWTIYISDGNKKGWLPIFSFETLNDCLGK